MCSLLSRWLTTLDQAHDCRMQSLWRRRWPLGHVGLTTTGYRRSLNCGGAGRSSLPLHLRALSLTRRPHQVPAHHLLTLNSQHSGCQRCLHLTAACKYGSDAPR